PASPEHAVATPWALPWISTRLRQPDGCPWDREQTHETLRKHLLEESYEVYDALGAGATPALAEELGDLLLQVILHAQLAAEEGVFDLTDVNAAIATKIVRRHPHVFGDAEARTASDVNRQWERIKAAERSAAPAEQAEEYGDLLFVLVNVARWQGIEAEAALRSANDKFRRRFASVERQAAERGAALRDLDFAALDALWDAAKAEEKEIAR